MGVRLPIKIDLLLVELDLEKPLLRWIQVSKKNQNNCIDFKFYIDIEFDILSKICDTHGIIGHDSTSCSKIREYKGQLPIGVLGTSRFSKTNHINQQYGDGVTRSYHNSLAE